MNKFLKAIITIIPFLTKGTSSSEQPPGRVLSLRHKKLTLPESGRFVMESHYATTEDNFSVGLFPSYEKEKIAQHLSRSFEILKRHIPNAKFEEVYGNRYASEWTPANDGGSNEYGQAARGNIRPSPEQEIWWGNMLFKEMPSPGTKFLISNPSNGRMCVIQMGYEIGPGNTKFLGGVSCEVHYYLRANNETTLTLSECEQTLPLGPVK